MKSSRLDLLPSKNISCWELRKNTPNLTNSPSTGLLPDYRSPAGLHDVQNTKNRIIFIAPISLVQGLLRDIDTLFAKIWIAKCLIKTCSLDYITNNDIHGLKILLGSIYTRQLLLSYNRPVSLDKITVQCFVLKSKRVAVTVFVRTMAYHSSQWAVLS